MASCPIIQYLLLSLLTLPVIFSLLTNHPRGNTSTRQIKKVEGRNDTLPLLDFVFPDSPILSTLSQRHNVSSNNTNDEDYDDDKIGGNAIATILG